VPGDPLAGFLLAAPLAGTEGLCLRRMLMAAGASLMVYCAGLVHNDLCDYKEDLRDRPARPLPSGRIRRWQAFIAFLVLLHGGLLLAYCVGGASFIIVMVLIAAVIAYNRFTKPIPVVGPINMGLCRGLSLLLGAGAFGWDAVMFPMVIVPAAVVTLYVASLTAIAARETVRRPVGPRRNLPACVLAFFYTFFIISGLGPVPGSLYTWVFLAPATAAVLWAGWCAVRIGGTPEPRTVQQTVGMLIRGLLPIQAAFCCLYPWPGFIVAGVLIVFWSIASILGRRFYGS
jgi:4-hydroxybenzoate polyprenyltransferase